MMLQDKVVGKKGHRYFTAKLKRSVGNPSRLSYRCDLCNDTDDVKFIDDIPLCIRCRKSMKRYQEERKLASKEV